MAGFINSNAVGTGCTCVACARSPVFPPTMISTLLAGQRTTALSISSKPCAGLMFPPRRARSRCHYFDFPTVCALLPTVRGRRGKTLNNRKHMKMTLEPMKPTPCNCAICGAAFPTPPPSGGGSGYAVTRDGLHICYTCADAQQCEELKDRSKPLVAYVSSDGTKITTWTGGELMRVIRSVPCKLTRNSYTHSQKYYRSIRARDIHGGLWYGRGSAGIAITLRPAKG